MKRLLPVVLMAAVVLAGCHSYKKENIHPPTPLDKNFKSSIAIKQVWDARIGKGAGLSGIRLRPTYADGRLYVISTDGHIAALDAATGKTLWERSTRMRSRWLWLGRKATRYPDAYYSAGPVVVGDQLLVGTLDGHVYSLDAKTGEERWHAELAGEVLSAPAVAGDQVIVRTEDGRVYSLNRNTGVREWANDDSNLPALTLRGNSAVLAVNGVVFMATDDGKLVSLRLDNGEKLWEQLLASGEGRTDIERLNDADGDVVLDGTTLYATAYHGNLTAVDGPSGRPLWSRPFSSATTPYVSNNAIYATNEDSEVWAFDKTGGTDMWRSSALKYRWLSAPAVQGDYAVVGDFEGFVHWLKTSDGSVVGRERLSKKAIRGEPLVEGDMVYVEDIAGHIGAYRLSAKP
ncbi:outer membrane protein assembly factor BamB [Frateuria aurantia]